MKNLEANVWFDDVKTVYWTTILSDEPWTIFLTKEDAIERTNRYEVEDAEDYIKELHINPKEERVATNQYGELIIERLNHFNGKWVELVDLPAYYNF